MSVEELKKVEESDIIINVGRCLIENLGEGTAFNVKIGIDKTQLSFIGKLEIDEMKPQLTTTVDFVFPNLSDDLNPIYSTIEQITITYTAQNGEEHEVEKTVYV